MLMSPNFFVQSLNSFLRRLNILPVEQANAIQWCTDRDEAANQLCLPNSLKRKYLKENPVVPDKRSDTGGSVSHANDGIEAQSLYDPTKYEASSALQRVAPHDLNSQVRDSAISRYKEKRKTRRYHHHS
jgi:hypothetical protein